MQFCGSVAAHFVQIIVFGKTGAVATEFREKPAEANLKMTNLINNQIN